MADEQNPISDALKEIAGKAAQPEVKEAGPGDVGPTVSTGKDSGLVTLQMSPEETGKWWDRYEQGKQRVKNRWDSWDLLLKEYMPIVSASGVAETVKVQAHFRNVQTKMGNLFYRRPDLVLSPKGPSAADNELPPPGPPMPGQPPPVSPKMEDLIFIKQGVLNQKLGRDGIKVERLMDELIFDVLAWSGIGCSKLGYRCVIKNVDKPVMGPDPTFTPPQPPPGSMLGLQPPPQPPQVPQMGPDGQPVTQSVPVTVFEEEYWRRFSPKKIVFNHDLYSTRYDEDATFMGMDFYLSPAAAMKQFGLSEDDVNKSASDDMRHSYENDKNGVGSPTTQGLVHCIELWVKASYFTDEVHPQAIYQLILVEGIRDRPVVWRPSPYQEFDAEGKLTQDSMIGFPIRILTIRDLADSPFPDADSAFTNSEIKQMSTWRRQSIKLRDAQIGKFLVDSSKLADEEKDSLRNGELGEFIDVTAGSLDGGSDKVIAPVHNIQATNDDYRGYAGVKQDVDETLGISATQAGVPTDTVRTATEVNRFTQGSSGRNDKELSRVVDFYLDGARMIDQLLMRYATEDEYVTLEGENAAQKLQLWNGKMIRGTFYYDIAPDSQLRADSAEDYQLDLNYYNATAKDALCNRAYILRRMARRRGMDPNKAVFDPAQLQQPKAVPPSISFAFKGDDLIDPTVQEILMNAELLKPPTPPPAGAPPQLPPHGGPANKHEMGKSGGMPNAPGADNHRETMK